MPGPAADRALASINTLAAELGRFAEVGFLFVRLHDLRPPEHKDKVVQATKLEAEQRHHAEEWDGATTE